MINNNIVLSFVNTNKFKKVCDELSILCSNNSLSNKTNYTLTILKSTNVINQEYSKDILNILKEVSPQKLSTIYDLFDIELEDNNYFKVTDLIFTCNSLNIISVDELIKNKYYKIDEFLENKTYKPYIYFNSFVPNESRVLVNKNEKKDSKNTITLKIKNEDLQEDLLSLNLLINLRNDYLIDIKAYAKNDSYNVIKTDQQLFIKYFGHNGLYEDEFLYKNIHLRDCCLDSFNGTSPLEYLRTVSKYIKYCNPLCNNKENNNIIETMTNIQDDDELMLDDCIETTHFIQKFARNCFHTKYMIIVHTAEYFPQACLYLSLILLRCNNRLCRDFLYTLPNNYKQMIITSGFISGYNESKTDISVNEKEQLNDKIIFWKSYALKYGLNVKKLIDKCNELLKENEVKNFFGEANGDKERTRKMINNLEKIASKFYLLKVHDKLIRLITDAQSKFDDLTINSYDDINKIVIKNTINLKNMIYEYPLYNEYKLEIDKFKQSVIKRILGMSEGQFTIKKQIYQYVMDFITNPKPLTSRKILCLVGPPGVGKTYISLCIARILFFNPDENPSDEDVKALVYILSIPGITNENALLGSNAVYVGAQPGILTKELLFNDKLCRKLIILDEIDKSSKYIEQLIPILDYTQNSKISDNYFDIELDMRSSVLIATANDKNAIHPILKDRLHIIEVSGYSTYTKALMVQNQILGTLLKERSLNKDIIYIPLNVLEDFINYRTLEAGVRKLKELITDIIGYIKTGILYNDIELDDFVELNDTHKDTAYLISDEIALTGKFKHKNNKVTDHYNKFYKYDENSIEEFYYKINLRYKHYLKSVITNNKINSIILTKQDLDIIFYDKRHIIKETLNDITKWESGKVIGLYATTSGIGGILPITVKLNKSLAGKPTLVTLAAKDTMKDSAMISTMLVSDYLFNMYNIIDEDFDDYFGINRENFNDHLKEVVKLASPHIILDSSTPKDGPSAGGAFMIGYLSKILNHKLSNKVGITGEISSNFKITAIGGLNMKINGAMFAGCRSVVIPNENVNDMIREIVFENSIDVKNEDTKCIALIYYCNKEKAYILLIRSLPSSTKLNDNQSIKLSAFDVKVGYGDMNNLETHQPELFKIKLTCDKLIDPSIGFNKLIYKDIKLIDIMKKYFLILGLEKINEIYYYMVMSRYIYDNLQIPDKIDQVDINNIEYDGHTKQQSKE